MFIVIDGIDGVGKTTQVQKLHELLATNKDRQVLTLREPGSTDLGEYIRNFAKHNNIDPLAEFLLFSAGLRQNIMTNIVPALEKGVTVISDRFYYSAVAYQGAGSGVCIDMINEVNDWLCEFRPDLTIILDAEPKIALERKTNKTDKYETSDMRYYEKVRKGYLNYLDAEANCMAVDANRSIEAVHNDIATIVAKLDWANDVKLSSNS